MLGQYRRRWTNIDRCFDNVSLSTITAGDHVLTFMWYLKVTYVCNCNLSYRKLVPILVRNDISHLTIGLLVDYFFKISAGDHLGFLQFLVKREIGFMRNIRRAIYGYLGILRPIFKSDTQMPTPSPAYASMFYELMAVFELSMINQNAQRCQSGALAHINLDISCINNLQKKLYMPFCKVPPKYGIWLPD